MGLDRRLHDEIGAVDAGRRAALHLALQPMNDRVAGQATSFRVSGLDYPNRFDVRGASARVDGADLVVETTIEAHTLIVEHR